MLGDLKRLQVLKHQHLAGMNGGHDRVGTHDWFLAWDVSVVVDDLDTLGSSVRPTEADTPLLIDADAVGARPIALELLEPVSWRHPQIIVSTTKEVIEGKATAIEDYTRDTGATVKCELLGSRGGATFKLSTEEAAGALSFEKAIEVMA